MIDNVESQSPPQRPVRRKKEIKIPMVSIESSAANFATEHNGKIIFEDTVDFHYTQKINNLELAGKRGMIRSNSDISATSPKREIARRSSVQPRHLVAVRRSSRRVSKIKVIPPPPNVDRCDPLLNPALYSFYEFPYNTLSDTACRQFQNLTNFTRDAAVCGLSAGEKTAFWFYNKLRYLSRKWFTHFYLFTTLMLYSAIGAVIFMTLEGPLEAKYDKKIEDVRREIAVKIKDIARNQTFIKNDTIVLDLIQKDLITYEEEFTEYSKHVSSLNSTHKTWTFWNSMFYAGTIYTTIGQRYVTPPVTKIDR